MIALDSPTMSLIAAMFANPSGTQPKAHVVARTVSQGTKISFEEYQRRLTRTVFNGTASSVTLCTPPQLNEFKAIEYIGVLNLSGKAETIALYTFDGAAAYELVIQTLATYQGLYYEESRGWYVL